MKRILITGSRDWDFPEFVRDAIWRAIAGRYPVTLVHGGALGADSAAHDLWLKYAHTRQILQECYRPDYESYHPKVAPHMRNDLMVYLGADLCLAFIKNNSNGATSTAQKAYEHGIPVYEYHYNSDTREINSYYRNLKEGIDDRRA
jgi:hypothetical protein